MSIKCPNCGSEDVTAMKKGFSGGKAVAGAVLTGGIGLLAGLHGSGDIMIACMKCGHQWDPKKQNEAEQQLRNNQVAQDLNIWKHTFYRYYQVGQFENATEQYLKKFPFNSKTPDVHAAYKFHKKNDRDMALLIGGLLGLFFVGFALIYYFVNY